MCVGRNFNGGRTIFYEKNHIFLFIYHLLTKVEHFVTLGLEEFKNLNT